MASLDTKMSFTLKDLIMLVGFLSAGFGGYYSITGEISDLKKEQVIAKAEIASLKEANKALSSLPKDMARMQIDIKKNGKTITLIYYGLVAENIIPPPK